jgi:H+/gluconate symporter-like permease
MQTKQEILLQQATKWRVTAIWISILGVVVVGFFYFYLADTKKALSERKMALSESQKAFSEISEREKRAIKTLSEREIWINKLEQNMPKEKIEQLKAEERKKE